MYSSTTKILHWILALMLIALVVIGNQLETLPFSFETIKKYNQHKLVGLLAFMLILWRLYERYRTRDMRDTPQEWEDRLARAVHYAFYAVMVLMPLSGWAGASASGQLPYIGEYIFPAIYPQNPQHSEILFEIHGGLGKLLVLLFALHIAGLAKRLLKGDYSPLRKIAGRG